VPLLNYELRPTSTASPMQSDPPNAERFSFDNRYLKYNILFNCYMILDFAARFVSALLDLIDDFVSEFRTRMIATQLIRSVSSTAAKYRAAQRTRRVRIISKMCLVLEEANQSSASLERIERHRLSRRLEPVRQAIFVADEIIAKTFAPRGKLRRLPRYAMVPSDNLRRRENGGYFKH
jgi:hypothetical protein